MNGYTKFVRDSKFKAEDFKSSVPTGDAIANAIVLFAVFAFLLFITAPAGSAQATKETEQAAYIKALEAVVSACLSDATGRHIQVGDSHFLCGIVPIGDFK